MLNEEVARYRELSGDTTPNVPISRIGGYLDGYEKALEQEPCKDAISRQAVLESIKNLYPDMPIVDIMGSRQKWLNKYAPYFECENAVEQLPPVNPQPKTGRWIEHEIDDVCRWLECSNCHYETYNVKHNYCMNCGAKMVEPQESKYKEQKE